MISNETFERLVSKFKMGDSCWDWEAALNTHGYGLLAMGRSPKLAHRLVYEEFVGTIPVGLVIDHLCQNRKCMRPSHMEAVTNAENVRRGRAGQFWAAKQACPQGHEYSGRNNQGKRICRICQNEACRRHREGKASK